MGTTNNIVYGSDDDLEDDISHEYLESLPVSRSSTSSLALAVPDESCDTSGEQVADAMHEAHAGLFTGTRSINITDQTVHIDLDSMTGSSASLKRNLTTMEQLNSKRPAYSSRTSRIQGLQFDAHHQLGMEPPVITEPPSKKTKRVNSTPLPPSQRPLKAFESKRSASNSFDMPSSHETHAAGSKELARDSPEYFRTQTTVPFTNPTQRMLPPTQNGSPIVLIPPIDSNSIGNQTQGSVGITEPGSSAVLEAQIDGIGNWLEEDIAQARQEQEVAQQGPYLPDAKTGSLQLPRTKDRIEEESQGSVNPQDLMLDPDQEGYFAGSSKSSQDPLADREAEQDASVDRMKALEQIPVPNVGHATSKPKPKSSKAEAMDELEAGLPPPEMYKPRPSKSRGRRATADPSPTKGLDAPKKRKGKRSRTMGDASIPNEGLDETAETPRPTKKLKREPESTTGILSGPDTKADGVDLETESRGQLRHNTIELGDTINEPDPEPEPAEPAPQPKKKKRGRPSKAEKERQATEEAQQAEASRKAHAEVVEELTAPSVEPLTDPEEDEVVTTKKRKSQSKSRIGDNDSDSEDELAGKGQRKKPTTQIAVGEEEMDEPEEPSEPVKKTAKRGRKPKAKPKSVEVVVDEPEEVNTSVMKDEVRDLGDTEPEAARVPLQDKSDSQNQKLQVLVPNGDDKDETQKKPAAPETPQAQKGLAAVRPSPFTTGTVRYRVGLSRRSRIKPLLKTLKR